jgi:hypothetical protein
MLLAWGDFQPFTGLKDKIMMLDFEGQFSFEDKEKLTRADVRMADFTSPGRHELFDDAELWRFDQVPTVTVGPLRSSPLVVLCGFCADDLCRQWWSLMDEICWLAVS